MIDERLKRCLEPGVSLLVGSVDAHGAPLCCRAVALRAGDDNLTTVTAYVPLAISQDTIANLASTHRIAITVTDVVSHGSTQLKGLVTNVRLARDDEAPMVRQQLARFADVVEALGLPKRVMQTISVWPAFAIDVAVEEAYDQTPGPRAGSRVQ
jgi:hypothetical protein